MLFPLAFETLLLYLPSTYFMTLHVGERFPLERSSMIVCLELFVFLCMPLILQPFIILFIFSNMALRMCIKGCYKVTLNNISCDKLSVTPSAQEPT
jgi:hypothetical protein